MKTPCRKTVDH